VNCSASCRPDLRWAVTSGILTLDWSGPSDSNGSSMSARFESIQASDLHTDTKLAAAALPTSSAGLPFAPSASEPRKVLPPV